MNTALQNALAGMGPLGGVRKDSGRTSGGPMPAPTVPKSVQGLRPLSSLPAMSERDGGGFASALASGLKGAARTVATVLTTPARLAGMTYLTAKGEYDMAKKLSEYGSDDGWIAKPFSLYGTKAMGGEEGLKATVRSAGSALELVSYAITGPGAKGALAAYKAGAGAVARRIVLPEAVGGAVGSVGAYLGQEGDKDWGEAVNQAAVGSAFGTVIGGGLGVRSARKAAMTAAGKVAGAGTGRAMVPDEAALKKAEETMASALKVPKRIADDEARYANRAKKTGQPFRSVHRILAEEGLAVKGVERDGRPTFDSTEALETVSERQNMLEERYQKLLGSRRGAASWDPEDLREAAHKAVSTANVTPAQEAAFRKSIDAEFDALGGMPLDPSMMNRMKRGTASYADWRNPKPEDVLWEKVSGVFRERLEDAFSGDDELRAFNRTVSDYIRAKQYLKAINGHPAKNGLIGQYVGMAVGAVTGAPIPIIGPIVGSNVGGMVARRLGDPTKAVAKSIARAGKALPESGFDRAMREAGESIANPPPSAFSAVQGPPPPVPKTYMASDEASMLAGYKGEQGTFDARAFREGVAAERKAYREMEEGAKAEARSFAKAVLDNPPVRENDDLYNALISSKMWRKEGGLSGDVHLASVWTDKNGKLHLGFDESDAKRFARQGMKRGGGIDAIAQEAGFDDPEAYVSALVEWTKHRNALRKGDYSSIMGALGRPGQGGMAGFALGGFEPEIDEDGKWTGKMRWNPENALAGAAIGTVAGVGGRAKRLTKAMRTAIESGTGAKGAFDEYVAGSLSKYADSWSAASDAYNAAKGAKAKSAALARMNAAGDDLRRTMEDMFGKSVEGKTDANLVTLAEDAARHYDAFHGFRAAVRESGDDAEFAANVREALSAVDPKRAGRLTDRALAGARGRITLSKTPEEALEWAVKAEDAAMEIDVMANRAMESQSGMEAMAKRISDMAGTMAVLGPVKTRERALRKAMDEYGGDAGKIRDFLRATVVVPDEGEAVRAINALRDEGGEIDLKPLSPEANNGFSGFTVFRRTRNGLWTEWQVNVPEILYAKDGSYAKFLTPAEVSAIRKRTGKEPGLGHGFYERIRDAKSRGDAKAMAEAETEQRAYYAGLKGLDVDGVGKAVAASDSAVPYTLYHGTVTGADFDRFDTGLANRGVGMNAMNQGKGIYLTESEDYARLFSRKANQNRAVGYGRPDEATRLMHGDAARKAENVLPFTLRKGTKVKALEAPPSPADVERLKAEGYSGASFPEEGIRGEAEGMPSDMYERIYGEAGPKGARAKRTFFLWDEDAVARKKKPTDAGFIESEAALFGDREEFVRSRMRSKDPDAVVDAEDVLPWEEEPRKRGTESGLKVDRIKHAIYKGEDIKPIFVSRRKDGGYDIWDGHHRFQAYQEMGIRRIPVKFDGPGLRDIWDGAHGSVRVYRGQQGQEFTVKGFKGGVGRSFSTDRKIAEVYGKGGRIIEGTVDRSDILTLDGLDDEMRRYAKMIVDERIDAVKKGVEDDDFMAFESLVFELGEIARIKGKKAIDINSFGIPSESEVRILSEDALRLD